MHSISLRKLFIFFLVFAVFFSVNSLFAQKQFEGKIKFSISDGGNNMIMDYIIKNNMVRIEMPGNQGGAMIMKDKKMYMVMPSQKMYMEFSMDKMKKMAEKYKGKANSKSHVENFDINSMRTGKTKEIFGHKCEQWIYNDKDENTTVEMWIATDMGNFFFAQNPMAPSNGPAWQRQLEGKKFFPMEVISKDSDGTVKNVFKVIEIKNVSVNSDLFNIPEGFNKMTIPGMN